MPREITRYADMTEQEKLIFVEYLNKTYHKKEAEKRRRKLFKKMLLKRAIQGADTISNTAERAQNISEQLVIVCPRRSVMNHPKILTIIREYLPQIDAERVF